VLLLHEFEFELLLVQSGKRSCFSVSTSDSGSLLGSCPAKLWGLGDIGGIDEETVEPVCEASSDVSTLILLKADSVHEFELDSAGEDRRQWLPLLLLLGELKGSGVSGCDTLATTLEFLTRSKRSGALFASLIVGLSASPCSRRETDGLWLREDRGNGALRQTFAGGLDHRNVHLSAGRNVGCSGC